MRYIITATLLVLPCFAAINGGESIMPNIIGTIYTALLILLARTKTGRRFIRKTYREHLKIEKYWFNK